MHTTRHELAVTLNLAEGETLEPGHVIVEGEPYDLTDEQALELVLPKGRAPTRLDFESVPGFVRFGATMAPAERFRSLSATVVSSSRPPTPEETAAFEAGRAAALEEPKE